jgi:L-cysteine S-thiosulfotransferase
MRYPLGQRLQHSPFIPAQAGIQGPLASTSRSAALGPRFRGDERIRIAERNILLVCSLIGAMTSTTTVSRAAEIPLNERKSGYEFMGRDSRAMQDDDTANPGTFSVLDGEALWKRKDGSGGKSCADCHGEASESMKGVAARYPAFNAARGRPINLDQQINICRAERQQATPLPLEGKELLALNAYVARQSRGMPINVTIDERTRPFLEAGRATFYRRQGQLNFACAQCHDDNWKEKLAGSPITQAHPTGYPLYRLEWQNVGSLQRRLRNCISGMRVDNYPVGANELVDLELFLMWRARGMPIETPAVRP